MLNLKRKLLVEQIEFLIHQIQNDYFAIICMHIT